MLVRGYYFLKSVCDIMNESQVLPSKFCCDFVSWISIEQIKGKILKECLIC